MAVNLGHAFCIRYSTWWLKNQTTVLASSVPKKEQWRTIPVQDIEKLEQKMKYQHIAVTTADRN
ncbi:hypothetical protein HER14_15810 [Acidithiobacillus thiooxidans]|uniref:hypothetical protein n=1 Tax=Acidithiobacillus TaxID=119977 RepID=UPI000B28DCE5|nr:MULTISPECIES: hypothetical protein [Acidithiobacillus]MBE7567986.1 hypothetical protein [Acidithiobacillus sp. HP-11]MBU2752356.1 hypothetical protein [Acidithiobacillus thiooxidans]MBU2791883.1 hypothetical protein [Acidithiobacillus thiooxidans]MBU2837851.1 hypothetical protein [Acidithiobacillus thiooxidans]